jgi:hypothetical protein
VSTKVAGRSSKSEGGVPPPFSGATVGRPISFSSIGVKRYTLMAVRKDLPSGNTGRNTLMLDHLPQLNPVYRQRPRTVEGGGPPPGALASGARESRSVTTVAARQHL